MITMHIIEIFVIIGLVRWCAELEARIEALDKQGKQRDAGLR